MSDARVRTSIIGVVVFALFSALFARLWYLQVAAADQFHAAATSNAIREIREPAPRGRILDAQGNVLADNRVENDITVDRKISAADKKRVLKKLSVLLATPVAQLEVNLKDPRISPYTPVPVATDVAYDKLAWVAEHKSELPGVRAEAVPVRRYPNGSLASHVLGYVGEINEDELKTQQPKGAYALGDTIGKSGVELSYESDLRGRAGVRRVEVDATGRVIRTISSTPPRAGTRHPADARPRGAADGRDGAGAGPDGGAHGKDTELQEGVQDAGRAGGVRRGAGRDDRLGRGDGVEPELRPERVRARDPRVDLAGATRTRRAGSRSLDRAVSGQYAPGSTFKLMTAIAGLTSGDITATRTINDTGRYAYPTRPESSVQGRQQRARPAGSTSTTHSRCRATCTSTRSVASSTTAGSTASPVGTRSRPPREVAGVRVAPPASRLPNEAAGRVPDPAWKKQIHEANPTAFPYPDWLPGDNILYAIGQGDVLVTPIQLATAYATLANGGTRFSPRLADAVYDADGHKIRELPAIDIGHVDMPDRDTMLAGLTGVVEYSKGTARGAFAGFPQGLAAGKTGTAQVQGSRPRRGSWA